jgi:Spy/CpxP family protein refolding chaperone
MAVNLTDEQRQKLQQIEQRHRRWRHRHGPRESAPESPSAPP